MVVSGVALHLWTTALQWLASMYADKVPVVRSEALRLLTPVVVVAGFTYAIDYWELRTAVEDAGFYLALVAVPIADFAYRRKQVSP